MDAGEAVEGLDPPVLAGVDAEQARPAAGDLQVSKGHGKQECGLDVDATERLGGFGEVLALAVTGGYEWPDRLPGPGRDGIGLATLSVGHRFHLPRGAHRAEPALQRWVGVIADHAAQLRQ